MRGKRFDTGNGTRDTSRTKKLRRQCWHIWAIISKYELRIVVRYDWTG